MFINHKKGFLQDFITQFWVKVTGTTLLKSDNHWLFGPTGDTTMIGNSYVEKLAKSNNLLIEINKINSGLIDNFSSISKTLPHSKIIDFYEHTTNYKIEVTANWKKAFIPFGWLLKIFFSKRLQQLNLPTSNNAFTQGLKSDIIKLKTTKNGDSIWTIWHRKSIKLDEVIFSGIYTSCITPDNKTKMKVIFPLPNGSATILFDITVTENGNFVLESKGRKIGKSGFYFIVNKNKYYNWVRLVKSMHEKLSVSVNAQDEVSAVHQFKFWKMTFLELNYKMILNQNP